VATNSKRQAPPAPKPPQVDADDDFEALFHSEHEEEPEPDMRRNGNNGIQHDGISDGELQQQVEEAYEIPPCQPPFWHYDHTRRVQRFNDTIQELMDTFEVERIVAIHAFVVCSGRLDKMRQYLDNPDSVQIFTVEQDMELASAPGLKVPALAGFSAEECEIRRAFLLSADFVERY
jgi:hypothetical protein